MKAFLAPFQGAIFVILREENGWDMKFIFEDTGIRNTFLNRDTKWHMGMGIPIPYHCFLFSSLLHSTITSTISYLLYYTVRTTMGNTDGTGGWWTDQSGTLLHHPEQSAVNLPIRIPCRWQQWSLCLRAGGTEGRRSQGDMEAEGEVWMETRVRVWDIEQQKGADLIQKVKD